MTDIHTHILYGVDDGADTPIVSNGMLEDAISQGIDKIIFTPHYRPGMFDYDLDTIRNVYATVKEKADELGIEAYLGCEYHVDGDMVENLQNKACLTLADSDYVLAEYEYSSTYGKIRSTVEDLLANGYTPVIAHAERYEVFIKKPKLLKEFREMGAMIQINADSVIGKEGFKTKILCKTIIKERGVDIIASDCHNMTDRGNHMKECRDYVAKKYGEERAQRLFETYPGKIFER